MSSDWRVLGSTKCRCGVVALELFDAHPVHKIKHHLIALTVSPVALGDGFSHSIGPVTSPSRQIHRGLRDQMAAPINSSVQERADRLVNLASFRVD